MENKELLVLIYDNTFMGINTITKLLNLIKDKDNKIKSILEKELKEYEKLFKECKKLMKEMKVTPSKKGLLKNLTANTAIKIEVSKDNSDSKIANILIRGFNMGNIDIESRIRNYKNETDKNIIKLANNILDFGKEEIKLLEEYL